jgi:hypothetical protein
MPAAVDRPDRPQGVMDAPGSTPRRRASLKILSRNIDQVVLGNMLFDAWYYSPYPDAIILGPNAKPHPEVRNGGHANGSPPTRPGLAPACPRLYVCPICFCYSPEESDYAQHLMHHQEKQEVQPVPETAFRVYEWDGYVVWEVDGEAEKLYCQNLSLFAKLFLEQKSVFFDTGGFKYYVLTHTPPSSEGAGGGRGRPRRRASSAADDLLLMKTKVLGFFSKENLSWDSNNLACILVFPPFQHRQLGQLLMAVSYKLSGWEWEGGVIGGPEKPLSAMGRKSYLRFWSERVARFFMGQTEDADQHKVFEKVHKRKNGLAKEEMTVKEIGDRTGMLSEDVVAALNEMGVCEVKMPKRKKKTSNDATGVAPTEGEEHEVATMLISRAKVLQWAENNRVELTPPVREEGFIGEWALSSENELEEATDEEESA